jgi:Na+/melibiose symporter-like transporter
MHLSYNQKETDSVTMYRVIFELLGTLAGIIAYTISFAIFVGDSTNNCADGRLKDYHKENAFRYHAVAVAVIIIISLLITFFSVKEQKGDIIPNDASVYILQKSLRRNPVCLYFLL